MSYASSSGYITDTITSFGAQAGTVLVALLLLGGSLFLVGWGWRKFKRFARTKV